MSEMETSSDEELWQAAIDGSVAAWGDLFLRHQRAVYDYCFLRTASRGAAEDLTSAVFLEAWRLRTQVRLYGDSALPWLYGLATMLTRNHERTLRRYRGALQRIAPADAVPDPAPEIARRIDAQRQVEHIRSLLREVPQRDREVLELAALGTLSVAQIATALGIAPGTVKSRLSRARARLAGLLARNPAQSPAQNAPPAAAATRKVLPITPISAGPKRSGAL
jgi:RNA polymerase sigma-70 factor, ECF subfamily